MSGDPDGGPRVCLPEEYPQDVGHQEDQTHVRGEALRVLGPADVPVLGHVGHQPAEHHGPGRDPRHQVLKHGHDLVERLIVHVQLRLNGGRCSL